MWDAYKNYKTKMAPDSKMCKVTEPEHFAMGLTPFQPLNTLSISNTETMTI